MKKYIAPETYILLNCERDIIQTSAAQVQDLGEGDSVNFGDLFS